MFIFQDGRPDSVVDGEQDEMKQDEMMQVEMSIVRSHRDVVTPPPSTQPWLSLTPEGQIPGWLIDCLKQIVTVVSSYFIFEFLSFFVTVLSIYFNFQFYLFCNCPFNLF